MEAAGRLRCSRPALPLRFTAALYLGIRLSGCFGWGF
jgi:hypothetical protein